MKNKITINGKEFEKTHGSPFDCGSADSYYNRIARPHYYKEEHPRLVTKENMTQEQIEAYLAGYEYNECLGHKKDYL